MELQYVYTKKRSEFGRDCRKLKDDGPPHVEDILPVKELFNEYILKNPVHRGIQCSHIFAEHEVNTVRAEFTQHGVNHTEGGWPKDVNPADEEQTIRFRKKVEKDEAYIHSLLNLTSKMEHCILQNNAVNIYEAYFSEQEQAAMAERAQARTVNVYRDPDSIKRPVTHVSWSPDGGVRIAVTHCNLEFQRAPEDLSTYSYIWDVDNPNKPNLTLKPTVPIACLEYNPKDPNCLVSGLYNGTVAFWDVRKGSSPAEQSTEEPSHRDPVNCVLWISSKSESEFFSASTDGQVKWWDIRKLSEPLETLILDVVKGEEQLLSRALGASALEYESTIPTRFMVGTENGSVLNCNRKAKTAAEKITTRYFAHLGPVYAVQRNPQFVKNFLTIGDWTARIWSEECKESSIMWTSYDQHFLMDGKWSPTRPSVFYTVKADGSLDAWDILQQQREPCLTVKVCDSPLNCINVHEQGQLVAVGSSTGTTYMVEFSEILSTAHRNDRSLLTAMFDRESRREKILEARGREIRLKLRAKAADKEPKVEEKVEKESEALSLDEAESDFFKTIAQELKKFKQEEESRAAEDQDKSHDDQEV